VACAEKRFQNHSDFSQWGYDKFSRRGMLRECCMKNYRKPPTCFKFPTKNPNDGTQACHRHRMNVEEAMMRKGLGITNHLVRPFYLISGGSRHMKSVGYP
jgi:hypothetical protein